MQELFNNELLCRLVQQLETKDNWTTLEIKGLILDILLAPTVRIVTDPVTIKEDSVGILSPPWVITSPNHYTWR